MNIFDLKIIEENNINNINKNEIQNLNKINLEPKNEKIETLPSFVKEENNLFYDEEYINIFSNETRKIEGILSNNDNLRKDSFMSSFSSLNNVKIFNSEKDNIFT